MVDFSENQDLSQPIFIFGDFVGGWNTKLTMKSHHFGTRLTILRIPWNGVTARRSEPGKHAHTFRMTLVSKDKLPQTWRSHYISGSWPRTHNWKMVEVVKTLVKQTLRLTDHLDPQVHIVRQLDSWGWDDHLLMGVWIKLMAKKIVVVDSSGLNDFQGAWWVTQLNLNAKIA